MRALRVISAITAPVSVGLFSAAIWTTGTTSDRLFGQAFVALAVSFLSSIAWMEP